MQSFLQLGGVFAFLFGAVMILVGLTATDIQLGFGGIIIIGGFVLFGMASIIGRLPPPAK